MVCCFELGKQAQTHTYLNPYRYSTLDQSPVLRCVSLTIDTVVGTTT